MASGPALAAIPITGQVLVDGEGLAGATISLIPLERRVERVRRFLTADPDPTPVATDKTDAQGFFTLEAPGPGLWKVRAEARGRLAVEHWPRQPLVEPTSLPPVELEAAVAVTVKLRGGEGQPLAGARWLAQPSLRPGRIDRGARLGPNAWRRALRFGISDEQGRIHAAVVADEYLACEVVASGYVPLEREGEPRDNLIELDLEAGAPRTVKVVDGEGGPVAGVLVLHGDERPLPLAETDERGEVSLTVPTRGKLPLGFLAADGRQARVELTAGDPKDQPPVEVVRLNAPTVLVGRVVELTDRRPIAGALVTASDLFGDQLVTDAQGVYRLRTFGDPVPIAAAAPGFLPAIEIWRRDTAPAAGPTLALPPGAAMQGQIVDVDGRPIADAEITAQPSDARPRIFMTFMVENDLRRRSDSQGRFSYATLPVDQPWELTITRPGFAPTSQQVDPLKTGEKRDLRVVMTAGLHAVGWVVDEAGRPVRGAELWLETSSPTDGRRRRIRLSGSRDARPDALTDHDGKLELTDLNAGSYDLEVRARGFAAATVRGIELVEGGETVDLGTVTLLAGATIEGLVVDHQERPISGAEIRVGDSSIRFMAVMGDDTPADAVSADDGSFAVLDQLPGSRVSLVVVKPGFVAATAPAVEAPTSEPVKLVLRPGSRVVGRVLGEGDQPLANAQVRLSGDSRGGSGRPSFGAGSFGLTLTDAEGGFVIEGIAPGAVSLTATAEGYQETRLSGLEVPADGDLTGVELRLERGATVRGVVRDGEGKPLVGAWIQIVDSGGERGRSSFNGFATSNGDGWYQILGVPPGRWMVKGVYEGLREAAVEAEIEQGINDVDLVFRGGVEISGRVVDDSGAPVAGAVVALQGERRFWSEGNLTMEPDGQFLIANVLPGTYQLRVSKDGHASAYLSEPLEVADQNIRGLELRLEKGATLRGRILGLDFDQLARVEVYAMAREHGRDRQPGQVDYSGSYRVDNLAPGAWTVIGQIPGRQTRAPLVIDPGVAEVEQDLEFTTGYTLSGRYLVDGQPVAGARVHAGSGRATSSGRGTTDNQGRFVLEGLEEATYNVLVYDLENRIQQTEQVELSGDQEITINIVTGSLSGRVADDLDQTPVKGAGLSLIAVEEGAASATFGFDRRAESDSRGYFSLGRIPEGRWKVSARRSGYEPAELDIDLAAGQEISDLKLSLRPTEGVVFEVFLPSGLAAGEAVVAVVDGAGNTVAKGRYTTTEEGRARIDDLPSGSFELLVASGSSAIARLPITSPGKLGRVQLSPGGRLEIVVPELIGDPEMGSVTLIGPGGRPHQLPTGWGLQSKFGLSQGRAEIGQLDAGTYQVEVEARDQQWTASVQVTPGALSTVEMR